MICCKQAFCKFAAPCGGRSATGSLQTDCSMKFAGECSCCVPIAAVIQDKYWQACRRKPPTLDKHVYLGQQKMFTVIWKFTHFKFTNFVLELSVSLSSLSAVFGVLKLFWTSKTWTASKDVFLNFQFSILDILKKYSVIFCSIPINFLQCVAMSPSDAGLRSLSWASGQAG